MKSSSLPFFAAALALAACRADAQVPPRAPGLPGVDVQAYAFEIAVWDTTDRIAGRARVTLVPTQNAASFWLDLVEAQPDGTGMQVENVTENGADVPFTHAGGRLVVRPAVPLVAGAARTFSIAYGGVPADGLVISQNKFGDRTFFGDNWPDRARHWLPVVDSPADKATVAWTVVAPQRVRVVANGAFVDETELPGHRRRTRYRSGVPLPTKVMVFGASPFAVERAGRVRGVPIASWVYPQNAREGFYDYALAVPIVAFFDSLIAPFPFEKLANVQSKTRYGGMENAGAIFYNEASVRGDRASEELLAHEIAHQWFGDWVTEAGWPHLWLSEGFATYLTDVYVEKTRGAAAARALRAEQRQAVLGYYEQNRDPLVDTTFSDPNELLNTNPYSRGAWVLHMLRREVGDAVFFDGLRQYATFYGGRNATTDSLQRAMERVAGRPLDAFFQQWTRRSGQPVVRARWQYEGGAVRLDIAQTQPGEAFAFPLDIALVGAAGDTLRTAVVVGGRAASFSLPAPTAPARLVLDPDVHLLFGVESVERGR